MFSRFETNKSTKGASKLRRDLINTEIANLRDLLPLPQSTRQRLSQLQLMALVCVYVRKANYFQQAFKRFDNGLQNSTPNIGFSKALSGFLMMLTQNGKLLYISDNAAEYLGHSMEDLLIHGDSVYDIIDKQDYNAIQSELSRTGSHNIHQSPSSLLHHHNVNMDGEKRMFLCRMNVSRNARRQMRFGDQKVVLIQGHYLSYLPLCSRNEPVFIATCTPIAMPETRECVVQGATNVFTSIHSMDMKFIHMDKNGEFHLEYTKDELNGSSWYQLVHWDNIKEAQMKHKLITQSEQDRSCIVLTRLQKKTGDFIWIHLVLQVRDSQDSNQQSVIVCTNQVLSDKEASVMLSNSWLYHYYSVQSKIQMGLTTYDASRLPQIGNNYYPYQPIPPPTATSTPLHHHHPHQHYQIHQMSPYDLQGHSTTSIHHYSDYSPPMTTPTTTNLSYQNDINHNSSPTTSSTSTTMKETNSLAPVDYSQTTINEKISSHSHQHHQQQNGNEKNVEDYHSEATVMPISSRKKSTSNNDDKSHHHHKQSSNHDKKLSKVDYKSVRISNKKYTFKRIESLQISECHPEVVNDVESRTTTTATAASAATTAAIYDNHSNEHAVMETEHRDGQMLYVNSSTIHSSRSRITTKNFTTAVSAEPASATTITTTTTDLDQWNPSPTWSDNNIQKVPDIMHQQLSPYLITTPPTPMSVTTPTYIPHGSTFTFDWAPEHFVPSAVGHDERNIMELTSASTRCYYNRPMMMGIDHHHHHHNHKDETSIRNS